MKHTFTKQLLLSCIIVLSLSFSTFAYGAGDNSVKVGYIEGYGVVDNINSIDNRGYGYDVLEAAERYSDLAFEYVAITESTVLSSLSSGAIELFGPLSYTEARAMQYEFSRSFGIQQIMLVSNANSKLLFDDSASFHGKTVTSLSTIGFDAYLNNYKLQKGITLTTDSVSNLEAFYASDNELALAGSLMNLDGKQVVANLGLEQLYFVARAGNSSLISAVNNALNTLEVNEPLFMNETYKQYYSSNSIAKPVLTVGENALLQSKTSYNVGYLSNHFPSESTSDSGKPEGIMVDLMDLIAAEAGIKLNYYPYSLDSVASHASYDLNIAWVGVEDFSQYYSATNSFSNSTTLMLLAKTARDTAKIGVLPFVTFDTAVLNEAYPNSQFVTYNTYADLAEGLENGDIDSCLVSNVTSDYVKSLIDKDNLNVYPTQINFPIRIFVNNALGSDYVELFNTLISRLDESEVNAAFLSQIAKYRAEPTLFDILFSYWYIYLTAILLFSGSFFVLFLHLQRKKQMAIMEVLNYDEITGLSSELSFIAEVEEILKEAEPDRYLIVTFDIDHFSLIRKQYGYDRSNEVLKKIGDTLEKNYPDGSIVARSKADLFLVFTPLSATGRLVKNNNVIDCAQGLLASTHPLSVSEGVYRIQDTSMPVQLMIDYCNMARLQGKSVYGLTVNEYTKELDDKRELNNSIVLRMERALVGKELIPYYQPKVHLKSNLVTGCEALVRWCDIDTDLEQPKVKYMPDEFIPLFEENGFIAKLDYHIFDEICSFIRRNIKEVDLIPKISINLSGITLLKNDLKKTLASTLERYRVLPKDIDLEITESAFTQYPKESALKVRMLRGEGFTISMDDFGTGASSLNRLKDMDITTIKLDKAFLDYNLAELKGSVIIGNMINMARRLGLEVVAEGVETKEQLSALKMLHCDLVQGYYYSRPVNETDFMILLQEETCLPDVERVKRRKAAAKKKETEDRGALVE